MGIHLLSLDVFPFSFPVSNKQELCKSFSKNLRLFLEAQFL